MQTNYTRSYAYENYIINARMCNTDEYGAHNSYMLTLMDTEEEESSTSFLKRSKLLENVQKYMYTATKAAIKRVKGKDSDTLKSYLERILLATNSNQLLAICNEGLELLQKYNPV